MNDIKMCRSSFFSYFITLSSQLWAKLLTIEKEKKAFNKNAIRESTIKQFGDTDLVFDMATTLFNEAEFEEDFAGSDSLS